MNMNITSFKFNRTKTIDEDNMFYDNKNKIHLQCIEISFKKYIKMFNG